MNVHKLNKNLVSYLKENIKMVEIFINLEKYREIKYTEDRINNL